MAYSCVYETEIGLGHRRFSSVSLRKILFSTSFILLAVRLTGAGAGFLSQLLLARLLAPEALGIFFAATSLAAVLGLASSLGYPDIVPRFLSRYRERGRSRWSGAFIYRVFTDALLVSLLTGIAVVLIALFWEGISAEARGVYVLAGLAVPLLSFYGINYSVALANRAFGAAYVPEALLRPIIFLLILAAFFLNDSNLSLIGVTAVFFGITVLMGLLQFALIRSRIPVKIKQAPARLVSNWRKEGIPLIAVALYTNLVADLAIILASPLIKTSELAAFGVALKLALLVGFCVQVAHSVIMQDLAEAHARKALSGARDTLRAASALPVAFTMAATIASALGGGYVLALFHPDFAAAKGVLTILIACQLIRAIAGPSAMLLTTVGAQGINAAICVASTVVLAVGNILLVPAFGMNGAAVAVLLAWSFWLGVGAIMLKRRTGLRCDLFALLRRGAVHPIVAQNH